MAVRYVKDFEFPAASGYTKSATKVTGQMYAKGGEVKDSAPKAKGKGLMVVIGVGMPKKAPMKKFGGGAITDAERRAMQEMADDAAATTEAERIMGRGQGAITDSEARAMRQAAEKKKTLSKRTSPYVPKTNIPARGTYSDEDLARVERGYAKGGDAEKYSSPGVYQRAAYSRNKRAGAESADALESRRQKMIEDYDYERAQEDQSDYRKYAKGGMTKAQKKIGKVMKEYKAGELHSGKDGPVVKNPKQAIAIALSEAGKSKMKKAAGGSVKHPDEAMDKALIKKMVKPEARKMMKGGAAKHPDEAMDKALIKKMVKPEARAMKSGGGVQSPLQSMKIAPRTPSMERAKAVPVASRTPMIQSPSMEAAAPAAAKMGVGIGESRPGKPNVGRIRAMMAKAASAAKPENAPSMMKRGGMTKGKC